MGVELLLLSSSRVPGGEFLGHVHDALLEFLDGCRTIHFVPFARADRVAYSAEVARALGQQGIQVVGLDDRDSAVAIAAIESAEVLFVGGGNSFRLLKRLQALRLLDVIGRRVQEGRLRYMGASAGSNMACPSLRTTNDMPIVAPASFSALELIPFQINPHYLDLGPSQSHMGETRDQRLSEFLEENDVAVLALREGAWLRRRGSQLTLEGTAGGRLFQRGSAAVDVAPRTDLSWLLQTRARFDLTDPQYRQR